MPNPIAHPAASIPFTRAGLVFSALVMGSLSPDFGYLIPLPTPYFMYTAMGLVLFDVPVGFILLWLFHALVKWPMLSTLPENLQRRLFKPAQGFSFGPRKRFLLILLSLLVGSITHVIWDSFTHEYGWTVQHFAFLGISVGGIPLYTLLKNLGTLLGVCILAYWFIRWLPKTPQSNQLPGRFPNKARIALFVGAIPALAVVAGAITYSRFMNKLPLTLEHWMVHDIMLSAGFIFALFVGLYCLAWLIAFHKTIRPARSSID